MRKGFVLAEILVGLIILAGVLVAVSEFLAGSLKATARNQSASEALLHSYAVAQCLTYEVDLSPEKLEWPPHILPPKMWPRVSEDTAANGLKLELERLDIKEKANTLDLVAYDVEAEREGRNLETPQRILRVYRCQP